MDERGYRFRLIEGYYNDTKYYKVICRIVRRISLAIFVETTQYMNIFWYFICYLFIHKKEPRCSAYIAN